MSISEIKKDAKGFLADNYWHVLGLCAMFIITIFGINFLIGIVSKLVPIVGIIVGVVGTIALTLPVSYGFTKTLYKMKKGENVKIVNYFSEGFNSFNRSITTWWSTYWRKFLKCLPGKIISAVGICLLIYYEVMLTIDSIVNLVSQHSSTFSVINVLGIIFVFVGWLITIPFVLQYIIYEIVAVAREDLNAAEVAKESDRIMKGNRLKYIGFILSFIGWYILCLLTCGLGFIFLLPYIQTAKVSFYQSLSENDKVINTEETIQPIQ